MAQQKADIVTSCEGSLWIFLSRTRKGRNWINRNISDAENGAAIAEHRYGFDIALGAINDGLCLQDSATGQFATIDSAA